MKQRIISIIGMVILIIILSGCGRFAVEGQMLPETTPTPLPSSVESAAAVQIAPETSDAATVEPPQAATFPRLGFSEILIIFSSVLVAASLVLGIYLTVSNQPPILEYRPMPNIQLEKANLFHLLQFNPDPRSLLLTLSAWTVTLGVMMIGIFALLLLGGRIFDQEQTIALTIPSAILIENNTEYAHLPLDDLTCSLTADISGEQLLCTMPFEGQALALDVALEDETFWSCTVKYGDEHVPCRASFDMKDLQTYIVLHSDLGLSAVRLQQIAEDSSPTGMTEAQWLDISLLLAALLALGFLLVLWRHSKGRSIEKSRTQAFMAAFYSVSISLMIFGLSYYLGIFLLLTLKLVD